jgi:putative addiction module CopG family antidote
MNVSLPPDLAKFIQDQIETSHYESADEVIRESLRLLKERDARLAGLRTQIRLGFDEIARGECEDYDAADTPSLAEDIKKRGRERLAARDRQTGTG